jgi:hypothetical protein
VSVNRTDIANDDGVKSEVMLIDEVATALKITRRQIQRLERRGAFPIPRLPRLDRHARYPRAIVERFTAGEDRALFRTKRRGG